MVQRAIAKRLSRQDWVDAALRSTAQVGLENVSVEALAKTLNATKGSFYWHFTDRAELVDAIQRVAAGEAVVSPAMAIKLLNEFAAPRAVGNVEPEELTERVREL